MKRKNVEKVIIKRIKRNKKKITTAEKLMAGIGVGSTLLGGGIASGAKPQPQNPIVASQGAKTSGLQKTENAIKDFFSIPKAKADYFNPALQGYAPQDSAFVANNPEGFGDTGGGGGVGGAGFMAAPTTADGAQTDGSQSILGASTGFDANGNPIALGSANAGNPDIAAVSGSGSSPQIQPSSPSDPNQGAGQSGAALDNFLNTNVGNLDGSNLTPGIAGDPNAGYNGNPGAPAQSPAPGGRPTGASQIKLPGRGPQTVDPIASNYNQPVTQQDLSDQDVANTLASQIVANTASADPTINTSANNSTSAPSLGTTGSVITNTLSAQSSGVSSNSLDSSSAAALGLPTSYPQQDQAQAQGNDGNTYTYNGSSGTWVVDNSTSVTTDSNTPGVTAQNVPAEQPVTTVPFVAPPMTPPPAIPIPAIPDPPPSIISNPTIANSTSSVDLSSGLNSIAAPTTPLQSNELSSEPLTNPNTPAPATASVDNTLYNTPSRPSSVPDGAVYVPVGTMGAAGMVVNPTWKYTDPNTGNIYVYNPDGTLDNLYNLSSGIGVPPGAEKGFNGFYTYTDPVTGTTVYYTPNGIMYTDAANPPPGYNPNAIPKAVTLPLIIPPIQAPLITSETDITQNSSVVATTANPTSSIVSIPLPSVLPDGTAWVQNEANIYVNPKTGEQFTFENGQFVPYSSDNASSSQTAPGSGSPVQSVIQTSASVSATANPVSVVTPAPVQTATINSGSNVTPSTPIVANAQLGSQISDSNLAPGFVMNPDGTITAVTQQTSPSASAASPDSDPTPLPILSSDVPKLNYDVTAAQNPNILNKTSVALSQLASSAGKMLPGGNNSGPTGYMNDTYTGTPTNNTSANEVGVNLANNILQLSNYGYNDNSTQAVSGVYYNNDTNGLYVQSPAQSGKGSSSYTYTGIGWDQLMPLSSNQATYQQPINFSQAPSNPAQLQNMTAADVMNSLQQQNIPATTDSNGILVYADPDYPYYIPNSDLKSQTPTPTPIQAAPVLYGLGGQNDPLTPVGQGTYMDAQHNLYAVSDGNGLPYQTGLTVVVDSNNKPVVNDSTGLVEVKNGSQVLAPQNAISQAMDTNMQALVHGNVGLSVSYGSDGLVHITLPSTQGGTWDETMSQQAFATNVFSVNNSGLTKSNAGQVGLTVGLAVLTGGMSAIMQGGLGAIQNSNGAGSLDPTQPVILYNKSNGNTVVIDPANSLDPTVAFVDNSGNTIYELNQANMTKLLKGDPTAQSVNGNLIVPQNLSNWGISVNTGLLGQIFSAGKKVAATLDPINFSINPTQTIVSVWSAQTGTTNQVPAPTKPSGPGSAFKRMLGGH